MLRRLHSFSLVSMGLFNGISGNGDRVIPATFVPGYEFWEYALFVLVGCVGGLIRSTFCKLNRLIAIKRRQVAMSLNMKGLEVLLVTTVWCCAIWLLPSLPFFSRCNALDDGMPEGFRQFNCPEGQYNALATLMLNPGGRVITLMFQSEGEDAFSVANCTTAGLLVTFGLCVVFGCSFSGGIFIPSLFMGATLGRAFGVVAGLDPRTYAIIGASATLGGVTRVLISLTVIVATTSSLTFFVTPVMIASYFSQLAGNWWSGQPGIYDVILHLKQVPFLEESCPAAAAHANVRARNIMNTDIMSLGTTVKVGALVEGLKAHRNVADFPVVDQDQNGVGGGTLVGRLSRDFIRVLLRRRDLYFNEGDPAGPSRAMDFGELDTEWRKLPKEEGDAPFFAAGDEDKLLNIAPYIQIAPHTFDGHGSAERAYEMFRSLGLTSLYVVDRAHRPIGIITRYELHLLESIGNEEKHEEKKKNAAVYMNRRTTMVSHFE